MEQHAKHTQAFLETFDAYSDAIYRFCVLKTSDATLAEDLTQETFTRYWQALRDGKPMPNVRAYLYTIANHMIIDWYRKRKEVSLDARSEAGYEPPDTRTPSAEAHASYMEICAAMDTLRDDDRTILVLRFVEGLDPKDIATILNISPNAASVRIDRALKRLRGILEPDRS